MTLLNIFSLDDVHEENALATLSQGQHLIGRGTLLKISDKRVSRNHAVIHVAPDKITLTSLHLNPCFFRANNSRNLTVLTKDQESELNDGDQFALLPDYWFRVKKVHECENFTSVSGKRNHEEMEEGNGCEDEEAIKKAKLVVGKALVNTKLSSEVETVQNTCSASQQPFEQNITETASNFLQPVEEKITISQNSLNLSQQFEEKFDISLSSQHLDDTALIEDRTEVQEINLEPTENNLNEVKIEPLESNIEFETGPSSSGTIQQQLRRERCWYGHRCFRKNPSHQDTFSHPGDQDYVSDPEDDRPDCPYGIACYRKNSDHRKEYKHTAEPAKKPRPQELLAKRKHTQKQLDPDEIEDDDYDYNDPFLNDNSSDDYQPTDSDSSGATTDNSQDLDVEYQDRKRMLKEAKKFIKKK
ncbi:aprataxin and PNK-like factor [Euwallacea fornicatus]|uniref:aprataxin and PNK-like factor n=1 Tax=Euwallacea fornicatus TaxID=995702 RepID=UPI00338ECCCA